MSASPEPELEISPEAAQVAFHEHLVLKATAARRAHGPRIDANAIVRLLEDREVVRYPTTLHFGAALLEPHEFAFPAPLGFHPTDGYSLWMHPDLESRRADWPLAIAYHIPVINYGTIADAEGCERYGAALLGLEPQGYYDALCALADQLGAVPVSPAGV